MRAAVYRAPGDIVIEDRDVPECGDDEILLRVRSASLCGTDMRIFKGGHFKIPTPARRVLGHEISGVVAKVGRYVSGYHEGMRVLVNAKHRMWPVRDVPSGVQQHVPELRGVWHQH